MAHPRRELRHPPRLALVGDRSPSIEAHSRIPTLLAALVRSGAEPIESYWLDSAAVGEERDLVGFDGIWILPGSPYRHAQGVLLALQVARTRDIPLLGTCAGFQYLLLEHAHNVCALTSLEHGEIRPDADRLLIAPLERTLFGEEDTVIIEPGTRAAGAMGAGPSTERYFCRFGPNVAYERALTKGGLVMSGRDLNGAPRVAELPDHPFFVGSLFQPELSSDSTLVHPLITAFASAVRRHSDESFSHLEVACVEAARAKGDRLTRAGEAKGDRLTRAAEVVEVVS